MRADRQHEAEIKSQLFFFLRVSAAIVGATKAISGQSTVSYNLKYVGSEVTSPKVRHAM